MIQLSPVTVEVIWVIMLLIWAPYSSLKGLIKIRENKSLFLPFKSYGSSSFGSH